MPVATTYRRNVIRQAANPIPSVTQPLSAMRESVASIAIIRRAAAEKVEWLAQWNSIWCSYFFVGGHKRPEESFRDCLLRELAEELALAPPDCLVAEQPLAIVEYTAWSARAGEPTAYRLALFDVQLAQEGAARRVADDPANRWLAEGEIRALRASDDRPISPTMLRLWSAITGHDQSPSTPPT